MVCKKWWNSWGEPDNFCSDQCETEYYNKLRHTLKDILGQLDITQLERLNGMIIDDYLFASTLMEEIEAMIKNSKKTIEDLI